MISMPFIKTILPASFGFGEPTAVLVDVHNSGVDGAWMDKRAAAGVFKDSDIRPEKGYSFIHLIAMGDSDYYGMNRNGDAFMKSGGYIDIPEPCEGASRQIKINVGNVQTHDTFVKYAKVYRDHINKDPSKAHGDVVKSAHNDTMSRIELMIKVPSDKWHDDLEKLANGKDLPFSMSCKVPYDICTFCGNKAASRVKYCSHLTDHMTEMTKSGVQIGAMNDWMKHFDISRVRTAADRIAYGLLKAADGVVLSGAELAEQSTLFPPVDVDDYDLFSPTETKAAAKLATLQKLSDIEKQIEAIAPDANDDGFNSSLAFSPEVSPGFDEATIQKLTINRDQIPSALGSLADVKISLSIEDFLKIVLGKRYGEASGAIDEAKSILPGIFTRMMDNPTQELSGMSDFEMDDELPSLPVRQCIHDMVPTHSMDRDPVQRRITIMVLRGNKPMPLRKSAELTGISGDATLVERIAKVYAFYKISLCQRVGANDGELAELVVLQNYCQ